MANTSLDVAVALAAMVKREHYTRTRERKKVNVMLGNKNFKSVISTLSIIFNHRPPLATAKIITVFLKNVLKNLSSVFVSKTREKTKR